MSARLYKNNALSTPFTLNQQSGRNPNALKIGQDSRSSGIKVTNEILYHAYEMMQYPHEGAIQKAIVISPPIRVAKEDIVNLFSYNNTPSSTDAATEYIKVYARIPKEHMSVGVPSDAIQAGDFEKLTPVPSQDSVRRSNAYTLMHPFFLMPVNPPEGGFMIEPQINDIIDVVFSDTLKTYGHIVKIDQSGIGGPIPLEQLKETAPDSFNMLNKPINPVFQADKGPVATLSENPYDISSMAPGKDVRVGTGDTIETVVFDGKLIDKKVAPHLAAMFRDAAADGVRLSPLTSGFRVGFIKDNLTIEELTALVDGGNYTNWDGNPYPKYTRVGASQERLRYVNCGPTKQEDEGDLSRGTNCRIATALPVKPGAWAGKQKSGHMMGNGVDVRVGSWGGGPSSKIKTARPDLLTKEYRWLCLNAYKYGFIRTVRSERWHWEWLPGKHQFSRVPRSNPLWDNQFTGEYGFGE